MIKELLKEHARSSFTKKGPGVRAQLRSLLVLMSQEDLQVVYRKGWDQGILEKTRNGKLRCRRE